MEKEIFVRRKYKTLRGMIRSIQAYARKMEIEDELTTVISHNKTILDVFIENGAVSYNECLEYEKDGKMVRDCNAYRLAIDIRITDEDENGALEVLIYMYVKE